MTTPASPEKPTSDRAHALARWLERRRRAVLLGALALTVVAGALASRLKLHPDFAHLLPPSARSVRDLRQIERRARVTGELIVAVESGDPALRRRAARLTAERVQGLPPALVSGVTFDDGPLRRFGWEHRFLYASLADLRAARDALARKIEDAKLRANPLYIDFEDAPAGDAEDPEVERLRGELREAEQKRDAPDEKVSKDGRLQMFVVHTPFSSGEATRGRRLMGEVARVAVGVRAELGAGVDIGVTGDVVTGVAEHDALVSGMTRAILLTVALCLLGLLLLLRSTTGVLALLGTLGVGTVVTFGFTRLAIGHLNLATAFLSSIVAGNGINFGIILLARHLEERRRGLPATEALAAAIGGTWKGTLAAALTASVAYASLVATEFRGFRHFGLIAGVGMATCWLVTYTVLPASIAALERRGWITARHAPAVGSIFARLLPRRPGWLAAAGLAVTTLAGVGTWVFLTGDPYEVNYKNLRSTGEGIAEARRWMKKIDVAFGKGISGGFVIAAPDRRVASEVLRRLRARDEGKPAAARLFHRIVGMDDLLPADQPEKLTVLGEIRALLDDDALNTLAEKDREELARLRPPDDLRALADADVPAELAWPFIERDGSRGRVVLAMPSFNYEVWNARDLTRFAREMRTLDLPDGTLLGGSTFVMSDVLRAMEQDGPRATLLAMIGAILVVALVVGPSRFGVVSIACGASGTLGMLAIGWLLGLKVNFLDFAALPITIGIGVDYAVNIVVRARQELRAGGADAVRRAIATTGGAVFLCSYTTVVGYGSLFFSQNRGIRSFGFAAMIGEVTCLAAAFVLGPSLLAVLGRRRARPPAD